MNDVLKNLAQIMNSIVTVQSNTLVDMKWLLLDANHSTGHGLKC